MPCSIHTLGSCGPEGLEKCWPTAVARQLLLLRKSEMFGVSMVAPFRTVVSLSLLLLGVESVCARVARYVEILRMPLVEAIRFQLQGHHMEAVIVRKPTVCVFENSGSIRRISMA